MALSIAAVVVAPLASAEDAWNPFLKRDEPRRAAPRQVGPEAQPPMPPMEGRTWWGSDRPAGALSSPGGYSAPPWASGPGSTADRAPADAGAWSRGGPGAVSSSVERDTLPPLPDAGTAPGPSTMPPAPDRPLSGSFVPTGPAPISPLHRGAITWGGLKVADAEALLTSMTMPPRSPVLAGLWRQLWLEGGELQSAPADRAHALAVRLEVLYRSGMLQELQKAMQDIPVDTKQQPLIGLLVARSLIGIGQHADGCQVLKAAAGREPPLPAHLKPEMTLLAGYCAAVAGNTGGVELATGLAREQGADTSVALQVLDQIAQGGKGRVAIPKHVSLTDFRFLDVAGAIDQRQAIERGDPPVLALFALGSDDKALRIAAAERAVLMNILPAASLADAYRSADTARPGADPMLRRAFAFKAAAGGNQRDLGVLLEDARGAGLLRPVALALDTAWDRLRSGPEPSPAAEAVIEALVLTGRLEAARAKAGSAGSPHWLALIDIADAGVRAPSEATLAHIQRLAQARRVEPQALHRLVTVLNALDMQVPLPLWEAASATPQPTAGYLPDTGVLSDLQAASRARDLPRTILLTIKALGPEGAEAANLLALDDAIRALKRAGLETQARQLGVEALLGSWPRRS